MTMVDDNFSKGPATSTNPNDGEAFGSIGQEHGKVITILVKDFIVLSFRGGCYNCNYDVIHM